MIRREGNDPQHYTISRRGKKSGGQRVRGGGSGGSESPDYESGTPSEEEPHLPVAPWTSLIVSSIDCSSVNQLTTTTTK